MSNLKAGFARVDVTPHLGTSLQGYFSKRYADGVLDPLMVTAVAFDDGEKRAVIISCDVIGFNQVMMDDLRPMVAKAIETEKEGVFICSTHTHLAPGLTVANHDYCEENREYINWFMKKVVDAAVLAVQDLAPAKLSYTRGEVKDVAFIRRFRMKDGSVRTNPGFQNPDIDHALGTPDENSSLLIIKREGAPEIGIVNFQVHPDMIGYSTVSADFPHFVRDTYELLIPNSRCMYINGAQGDTNHFDVRLGEDQCRTGYDRSRYSGRKIAMSVIANYELAEPLNGDKINYAQKSLFVKYNKGRPEQLEEALRINKLYKEGGSDAVAPASLGMRRTEIIAEANRIVNMMEMPDEKELYLTAVSVGDFVVAGFPGEPFTDIGRGIKANSKFTLTMPSCCANGYEGYYPMQSAFDEGGYEALTARYVAGTAEKLIEASTEIVNAL